MKKLTILAVAFTAIIFAACGGKKSANNAAEADSLKSFEQQQIEASIKMHIDSIASEIGKLKQPAFVREDANGTISLTKEEKQVKPNYLISPSVAEEATTLAEKYRILSALSVDKKIASLYEMPTEDYDKTITKLVADINDPSFKAIENAQTIFETTQTLYDEMEKNGRINYFWLLASAALVEELYIANQNADKFLSTFDDEAASNVTFRIILVLDAINRLAEYDPEIKPIADAVAPLEVLNATTVDEFKKQLAEAKDNIAAARSALVKKKYSHMTSKHCLTLPNDIETIPQLNEFIDTVAEEIGLDMSLTMSLNLAIEEAVVNVMEYAYPEGEQGNVDIEVSADERWLTFIISDNGIPFDPTTQKDANTTLSAEERPIGGLGIFLVRQLMDSINYQRKDGKNILTLSKKMESQ